MPYRVEFAPAGERTFRRLPAQVQSRLVAPIEMLAQAPRPVGARKVVGAANTWRIRVGEYRVVYEVSDPGQRVVILQVTRRSETTYRGLRLRERWGGWNREPFTAESGNHVSVYEKV